jgi:RNA polymerase sigma-70 factor (ECF subfamily)
VDKSAYVQARAAWPGVELDPERFAHHVSERDTGQALHLDDLYLACACLGGDRAALDAFEHAFGPAIRQSLSRLDLSDAERNDLAQALRIKLFVDRALESYSGRGALHGFVRSAATRAAIDLTRRRKERPEEDEILGALPATDDAELDIIRRKFSTEFRAAFSATLATLTGEERAILAQHHIDGLSIDELAKLLDVHRATVARRIVKLRETLLMGTRERLLEKLNVDDETLESLWRVAASRLDVSVFRLLRS